MLYKNIKNADADMIFTDEDKKNFNNATHCHICEDTLPKGDRKVNHVAKIEKWLKMMGLQRCVPSYGQIEKMKCPEHFDDILMKAKMNIKEYLKKNNPTIVRDHCHFTGKYRGAAHQHCNIMYRKTYTIPAYFHNFTGYDSHHIFKHLSYLEKLLKKLPRALKNYKHANW